VGNNHHKKPFPGEDFQMFEKDLPGKNTAGFNADSEIGDLPLETCETINNSWGFNLNDPRYKSTRDLVHYLVRAAGYGANFLLNVGPMPNGKIQPEFVTRLQEIGRWLDKNGESIYGTRGGPLAPRPWGVTTRKDDKVYVHLLDWEDEALALPALGGKVTAARMLVGGAPVAFREDAGGVVLRVPKAGRDELDTVVVVDVAPAGGATRK
jgi:alpha-L-fucosidase